MNDWNSSSYTGITFPDTPTVSNGLADESQSNGIINVKTMTINFGTSGNANMQTYIQNVVMKYLEEMIPSTTILEYTFDGKPNSRILPDQTMPLSSSFDKIKTAHVMIDYDTTTVWGEDPTLISEM